MNPTSDTAERGLVELLLPLTDGLVVTLNLALRASVITLVMAVVIGVLSTSRRRWVVWITKLYVETFRGTSALIQLYWGYFVLPLFGLSIEAMTVGMWVLGLNAGAYGSVVVRGAIAAVALGQWEGAAVLGLSPRATLFRVILPQALPRALPPLNNVLIELLKNTSLVSMITLADLTFEAQALRAATLRTTEIFGALFACYLVMALAITVVFRHLEYRAARWLGVQPAGSM